MCCSIGKVWQLGDRRDGGTSIDIRSPATTTRSQLQHRNDDERTPSATDKVCRQTVLAPTYGGPINKYKHKHYHMTIGVTIVL